jgi:hypothetical protein
VPTVTYPDVTDWDLEFAVYHPVSGALMFSVTSAGGGILKTGSGASQTTGLVMIKVLAADSGLLSADRRNPTRYKAVARRTDSPNRRELAYGDMPIRA